MRGIITSTETPGAEKNREIVFDRIQAKAVKTISDLIRLDDNSINQIRGSGLPVTISEVSDTIDADNDQILTSTEILNFSLGNDLEGHLNQFLGFVEQELKIGAYNENLSLQTIPVPQGGDPAPLIFNYDVLLNLTNLFVTDLRAARSLSSKLQKAKKFAEQGDSRQEAVATQKYLRKLEEETHQSITRKHSSALSLFLRITTLEPISN